MVIERCRNMVIERCRNMVIERCGNINQSFAFFLCESPTESPIFCRKSKKTNNFALIIQQCKRIIQEIPPCGTYDVFFEEIPPRLITPKEFNVDNPVQAAP